MAPGHFPGKPDMAKTKSIYLSYALKHCTYFRHIAACYNQVLFIKTIVFEQMLPTTNGNLRVLPHDMTLRGYNIPAGTAVFWSSLLTGNKSEVFPDPGSSHFFFYYILWF